MAANVLLLLRYLIFFHYIFPHVTTFQHNLINLSYCFYLQRQITQKGLNQLESILE